MAIDQSQVYSACVRSVECATVCIRDLDYDCGYTEPPLAYDPAMIFYICNVNPGIILAQDTMRENRSFSQNLRD